MQVDKRNGNVNYNDEFHQYWNDEGQKFISVTTLIGRFEQPFDQDFWSKYKALERLIGSQKFAAMEKPRLLKSKKWDNSVLELYDIDEVTFNSTQQDILDEWAKTNRESCERGTKIHAAMEKKFYSGASSYSLKSYGLGGKFVCKQNYTPLDLESAVYPEYLISRVSEDGHIRLAGQIDLLVKDGNDIYIIDYKGLPLDTVIPTKTGWTTIGDIKEGDEIFDRDGNITKVIHKSDIHYNPCYKITFDNGESIVADHEHRWLISFRRPDKTFSDRIMTTEEIAKWLIEKPRTSYNIPKILNSKPLNLPEIDLPIDPYVLGCWLGDGSKSCGILTNINPKVWEEISNRGYTYGDNLSDEAHAEMRTIYGIRKELNHLELLNNKFIPDLYMRASFQQRLDLLRGLMDTDGYYHEGRKRFVMGTTQEWQARDLIKLVSTLGIKATLFEVDKRCNGKIFKGWDVCFSTNGLNPFLVRNQDINFPLIDKHSFRNIVSVERVDTIATQCLEVDSPSHTFLFGESMIVTHNTNKELKMKSGYDPATKKYAMMKFPLNNLMDCNFMHYTLQLSTYAWMIEKNNPQFKIKKLILVYFDHNGNVSTHEVEYLKNDVERMLAQYRKEIIQEERAAKRKRIEF
jgi:hypothetical protein